MIKHNAGAEEVGHALCADEILSLNLQYLHITSSSIIYRLLVIRTHSQLSMGSNRELTLSDPIVVVIEWW